MIRTDYIETAWELLESIDARFDELRVRELDEYEVGAGHPLFAVDNRNRRHLLIPIVPDAKVREDKQSAGIHITLHRLLDDTKPRIFLDVVCRKPHLNKLFSIIAVEMLNRLLEQKSRPDLICQQVLNRWRELLDKGASDCPDLQTLMGLFGELWVLRQLVRLNPDSIDFWYGPMGGHHDFVSDNAAIEVKTTRKDGWQFTIHGVNQLEPPPNGPLYLQAVRIEQVANGGETLADMVNSITASGGSEHALFTRLASLDITPVVLEACREFAFRLVSTNLYPVNEQFPRIIPVSFKSGAVPNGVLSLNYQIDLELAGCVPLPNNEIPTIYAGLVSQSAT